MSRSRADAAVDQIFALPRAVQPPANHHFAGLQLHRGLLRAALFLQECGLPELLRWTRLRLPRPPRHRELLPSVAVPLRSLCQSLPRIRRMRYPAPRRAPPSCVSPAPLRAQIRAASASSGSTSVSVTSAKPHRRPLGRAVENAVGHALGAQRLVALLAQHPGDGVHDIGFAAAVGPDDAASARCR